jgi:hypothetical protein
MPNLTHNRIKRDQLQYLQSTRSSHIRNIELLIEILYIAVVSAHTACLSLKNYHILPTSCVRVFHTTPTKSADCIRNGINWWIFKTERQRVTCDKGFKFVCMYLLG